ncbi:MAG: sugar phosphate isomerase/epimerase family protein [Planctomycetota bacterium]|jgi:sugar phosphate isomerase/epimerase
MRIPKISLGSWAFSFGPFESNPWSFSKLIKYTAEAGYDGVEINGFRPHPHPDDYGTKEKCKELKKEISDLGLGISGYAPDFRDVPPAEVDVKSYLAGVEKCLRFCNHMDISILRVDTVSPPVAHSEEEYEKRFSKLANNWRAATDVCQKSGVLMAWEFEPGFWLNSPSEIKRIVEAVGHENFKVLFDTSHAYMVSVVGARQTGEKETLPGGVVELSRLLENHIGHFHLIDSDGTLHNDETSTHAPFGQGHIDFKEVLSAMEAALEGLEWWTVDFCFCPTTDKDAKHAVGFIKNVIGEISGD